MIPLTVNGRIAFPCSSRGTAWTFLFFVELEDEGDELDCAPVAVVAVDDDDDVVAEAEEEEKEEEGEPVLKFVVEVVGFTLVAVGEAERLPPTITILLLLVLLPSFTIETSLL